MLPKVLLLDFSLMDLLGTPAAPVPAGVRRRRRRCQCWLRCAAGGEDGDAESVSMGSSIIACFASSRHEASSGDETTYKIGAEASLSLSPRAFWCYAGESMVGTVASLAASCLRNTAPHQVSVAVCSKYKLAKHLQFKFEL